MRARLSPTSSRALCWLSVRPDLLDIHIARPALVSRACGRPPWLKRGTLSAVAPATSCLGTDRYSGETIVVSEADFRNLCDLVSQLALQTNRVALGLQGLSMDQELDEIARAAEELGAKFAE